MVTIPISNGKKKSLDTKLSNYDHDIKLSIQATTDLADRALSFAESNKSTINSLKPRLEHAESKIDHLSEAVEFLLAANKKRDNHILQNETYSRREHLLFRGYTTTINNTESCEDKVTHIMSLMAVNNVLNIKFVSCHYLSDNKQMNKVPILCRQKGCVG